MEICLAAPSVETGKEIITATAARCLLCYGISRKKPPEIIEEYGPDRTILKLSFAKKVAIKSGDKKVAIKNGDKKKVTKKTEQQLRNILEYMIAGTEYRTSEIAQLIGVKESRARVLINELVKSGKVEAIGKNKGRKYKIISFKK